MLKGLGARSAVLAAVAVGAVSFARADSEQTTRAVIRGSGSDVTLVYEAPPGASQKAPAAITSDVVGDALRMKAAHADDRAVVAFLRRKVAELPSVLDASVLREFRKAGAGESVLAFLSQHVALDIGETAEDTATAALPPSGEAAPYGAYPDLVEAGYPFYGGGGYGGYAGFGPSLRHFGRPVGHRGFAFRSQAFQFLRPLVPKAHPVPIHRSVPMPRSRMH